MLAAALKQACNLRPHLTGYSGKGSLFKSIELKIIIKVVISEL